MKDGTKRGAIALLEEYLTRNERTVPEPRVLGQILQEMFAPGADKEQLVTMALDAMT
jgi:hypothetical protein